jgi:phage tail-like protein
MADPGAALLSSFYFSVKVAGKGSAHDVAFQEVSGLSKEMALEEVVSGGENRFKYRLPGNTSYPNRVLKRGVAQAESPLVGWCQTTLDGGVGQPIKAQDIIVSLLDEDGQSALSWTFVKAFPIKWQMSDLKSQESSILVETIELAYRYFEINDNRDNAYAGVAGLFGN